MDESAEKLSDPHTWVEKHADVLFRYAVTRVARQEEAEDLVQETFLAALGAVDRFSGRSSEQTWLIGILRNKIVDHFRATAREAKADEALKADLSVSSQFNKAGNWKRRLRRWSRNPSDALEEKEFWAVFDDCVSKLPDVLSATYTLREMESVETAEVCNILKATTTTISVRLYRARILM